MPGFTVDSNITNAFSLRVSPITLLAERRGLRSGFVQSTGVGTQTKYISVLFRSSILAVAKISILRSFSST